MSHKCFWVTSCACLLSAVLVLNADIVQAQTPGQIPIFDQRGTGSCSAATLSDCMDSIITQAGNTIGIGTTTPDPSTRLHVVHSAPFSPAGFFESATRPGLVAVSTGDAGEGDVGIWGRSAISAGVLGDTNNPSLPGVLARSAFSLFNNPGLSVIGTSDFEGLVLVRFLGADGTAAICRNADTQVGYCSSSLRYKTDVRPFAGGLDIVNRLRPIAFTWKQGGRPDIGLAAEDVERVEPLLTFRNDDGEIEGVKYEQLSAVFVNAFTEQQALIQRQDDEISRQQRELAMLKVLLCSSQPDADPCR